jgi:hypothetical protein
MTGAWQMPPEPGPNIDAVRIANPEHPHNGQRWNRLPAPAELDPSFGPHLAGMWILDRPFTSPPPQMLTWDRLIAYAGRVEACISQWTEQGITPQRPKPAG